MKSFIAKRVNSILVNLRYSQLYLPKSNLLGLKK